MDIVVEKCFPIGYVDVIDPAVGGPQVGQPRGEKDELILQDKWNVSVFCGFFFNS